MFSTLCICVTQQASPLDSNMRHVSGTVKRSATQAQQSLSDNVEGALWLPDVESPASRRRKLIL